MTKIQKTWLWLFIIMFAGSELLFSPIILSFFLLCGIKISPLIFNFINENIFGDKDYFLIAIIFELIGLIGLLIFNLKLNKNHKNLLTFISVILIIFTSLILYSYSTFSLDGLMNL